jgi:hypothetical protein
MNSSHPRYWFPRKRYGWGWGPPNCWQGWLVLAAYVLAMALVMPFVLTHAGKVDALLFAASLTAVLLYVVYRKGEPPGWHWGD